MISVRKYKEHLLKHGLNDESLGHVPVTIYLICLLINYQ